MQYKKNKNRQSSKTMGLCNNIDLIHSQNLKPNNMERLHVDATILRSFRKIFSRFLPSACIGHVDRGSVTSTVGDACQTSMMATLLNP